MNTTITSEIYRGARDGRFQNIIVDLLKRGGLNKKSISKLTDAHGMAAYSQAFTAVSADENVNYEMYEQLGDVTANKFIVWYMYRRFPQLRHPLGVKVVARLRINYGARQSFSQIGEELGFWDFISASVEDRGRKKKDLLEDCVESFIGVTESLIDDSSAPGVGHAVVYKILKSVFDDITISLRYEDLYDAKTRIKELFDYHKDTLGKLTYDSKRDPDTGFFTSKVMNSNVVFGTGSATKLKDAEQKAAIVGLKNMNSRGISKPVPVEYSTFNK